MPKKPQHGASSASPVGLVLTDEQKAIERAKHLANVEVKSLIQLVLAVQKPAQTNVKQARSECVQAAERLGIVYVFGTTSKDIDALKGPLTPDEVKLKDTIHREQCEVSVLVALNALEKTISLVDQAPPQWSESAYNECKTALVTMQPSGH
ncbi:hypothetical protein JCM11491_005902 [Sporobolomyces phaffii]